MNPHNPHPGALAGLGLLALLPLAVALVGWLHQGSSLRQRDAAFRELQDAASRLDDQAAIAAADRFLAARSWGRQDRRTSTVGDLRAKAARWPADRERGCLEGPPLRCREAR
jgi:hypothetical protein